MMGSTVLSPWRHEGSHILLRNSYWDMMQTEEQRRPETAPMRGEEWKRWKIGWSPAENKEMSLRMKTVLKKKLLTEMNLELHHDDNESTD